MDYLAFMFLGFCLGALAGLKVAEVVLAQVRRDLRALEQSLTAPEHCGTCEVEGDAAEVTA